MTPRNRPYAPRFARATAWLIGASLLTFSWGALASPDAPEDELARSLKSQGDAAMTAHKFGDALDAYTRGQSAEAHPVFAYNRGRALQALERHAEALDEIERFKVTAAPSLLARVPKLEDLLASLRAQVSEVTLDCLSGGKAIRNAQVEVNGRLVELDRIKKLRLDRGQKSLVFSAPGYFPFHLKVVLEGGKARLVRVQLTPKDSRGRLRVTCPIPGTRVVVDSVARGTAPADLLLTPGTHRVEVEHPDYYPAEHETLLKAGETRDLPVTLEQRPQFYQTWWFWTAVAVVAAGTTVAVVAATTEKPSHSGDIPPGTIVAPLVKY